MRRRTLLTVGLAGAAVLAVAGGALALIQPARTKGAWNAPARDMLKAVALAVLADLLPSGAAEQQKALAAHLDRVLGTVAGMPPAMQAEVDELLTIAASAPGRRALIGLSPGWAEATPEAVAAALQDMRASTLALRQQAYHALRDITNGAYFADRSTWAAIGYPGPREMQQTPQA